MLAAVDSFRDVQLKQSVVGIQDVELASAPPDPQRTSAFLLVLQGQLLRLRLVRTEEATEQGGPVSVCVCVCFGVDGPVGWTMLAARVRATTGSAGVGDV